ncbi:unnamed protein product, partial [Prunus brigantina]
YNDRRIHAPLQTPASIAKLQLDQLGCNITFQFNHKLTESILYIIKEKNKSALLPPQAKYTFSSGHL